MIGLNGTLSIASQALSAETGALSIVNNNISNANTPGYSRQLVNLSAQALSGGGSIQDAGVSLNGFTSIRDQVLQIGINQKTSDVASLNAQSALWSQIQTGFSSSTSGVGASLTALFSSLSALSATPSDPAAKQAVMAAAQDLVGSFHQAAGTLSSAKLQADDAVSATVQEINRLSSEIAALNGELSTSQAADEGGGSMQDQRDALTGQLAGLLGVSVVTTQSTPNITTSGGTPLVVGSAAYALQVSKGSDGKAHVLDSAGHDITSQLSGGSLGGNLAARDSGIPEAGDALDQLATDVASALNAAQASGFDANGNPGQPLFVLPTGGTDAAGELALASNDPRLLALSSSGTTMNNVNLANLLSVQTQPLSSGEDPTQGYAALIQRIGNQAADISSNLAASTASLSQLTNQQASESGVSIDEETTNLLRFQQAYTAAAKVVSTINDLYSVLLNMNVVGA